jgi:hypothetical protein
MKNPYSTKLQSVALALIFGLLALFLIHATLSQAASSTIVKVVPSSNTPRLGETFTINITIVNVQNLYGVDITLRWNASVLQVLNVNSRLGVESHPDGVLHEVLPNAEIEVAEDSLSQTTGEYHIVATSVGPAAPFSGSGNVAIITFNVTSLGHSGLDLQTELADYPSSGEHANLIEHTDAPGSVDVIPEFPSIITVALFLILATAALAFSKKRLKHTARII